MRRHLIYIIGLLFLPLMALAQTDGYNPDNPPQPNWPEDDETKYYMLSVEAIPGGAGSFGGHANSKQLAGRSVYVSASDHNGNYFKEWKDAQGNTLSTEKSYYFTMPEQDITLYAIYDYNPDSPENPVLIGDYMLSLKCDPVKSCYFNFSDKKVTEGTQHSLRAYGYNGFKFINWTNEKGEILGTSENLNFLMPSHASTLTAHYVYEPDQPLNPGTNLWDSSLGELTMDFFTKGNLVNTMTKMVGGSEYQSAVTRLIVDGEMNSNDWSFANSFPNLVYVDLSPVSGTSEIPSYAFNNKLAALEEMELPDNITSIGSYAFKGCSSLTILDCYATVPPTLGTDVFDGVPEGLTVFVPESSVDLYKAATVWKDFTILPLRNKICQMGVQIPMGNYKDYALEIVNVKSGQKYKYVITDHSYYTFPNLIRNTTYRVYVKTKTGKVLYQSENVCIDDDLVNVVIQAIPNPAKTWVNVVLADNWEKDYSFQWFDGNGQLIGTEAEIGDLVTGDQVACVVTLNEKLKYFVQPDTLKLEVEEMDKMYELTCELQQLPKYAATSIRVKGKSAAEPVGYWLSKAYISIDQLFANKYHEVKTAYIIGNQAYEQDLYQVPTIITIQAEGYKTIRDTLDTNKSPKSLYMLDLLQNPAIGTIAFTYQTAALQGEDGEVMNYYPDYANVSYTVKNKTTGETVTNIKTDYPKMTIEEGATAGDMLEITAHSTNNAFEDVIINTTVNENYGFDAHFLITEKGGIQIRFAVTDNQKVKALLFDADNVLVKQDYFANFKPKVQESTDANDLTLEGLDNGTYTLISIGDSKFFNSIFDLSRFSELGLEEGVDYIKNTVTVQAGVIKKIYNAVVPLFDETKFYYTGTNTSFTANKANIIQGNYLTLNTRLDFLNSVKDRVSEVELLFPLPANCAFDEASLMVGKTIAGQHQYQYTDNREYTDNVDANGAFVKVYKGEHALTVQLGSSYNERVKFCVVPMMRGNYTSTAYVRFKLDGNTVLQPIGTINFTVNDVTIWAPALVSTPTVFVNGNAPAFSDVAIMDNGMYVGYAKALADGYWSTECYLNYPSNLSAHALQAVITTPEEFELYSETRLVEYNEGCIQAKDVDMRFFNSMVGRTVFVNFDLEHTTTNQPSYMFEPGVEFVFTANLTNNSPEVVEGCVIRVFTNNHEWIELPAQYVETLDRWVAHGKFDTQSMPIGVRVEVEADISDQIDMDYLYNENFNWDNYVVINSRSEGGRRVSSTGSSIKLEPIGDKQLGLDGNYFYDNLSSIDLSKYAADTLVVPTTETDSIRIYIADNGSFVVTGDNKDGKAWGFDQNEGASSRRATIDCLVTDMLKDAIKTITDLSPFLTAISDRYRLQGVLWQSMYTINNYEANNNWCSEQEYKQALVTRTIMEYALDNQSTIIEFIRKVNTLLAQARYGIDDTNDWQALSDRILPCTGLDDPQARSLNWTSLRYTRLHGVQYYLALLQTKLAAQMMAGYIGMNMSGIDLTKTENVDQLCSKITEASDFILYFATDIYQQNKAASRNHMRWVKRTKNKLTKCNYDVTEDIEDKWDFSLPYPIVEPIIDPSGYVYEGVSSNRLEGVTATAYYKRTYEDKYGDLQEEIVKWDAENYGQENPLLTDKEGMYQWDVPQGLWQVKFEKDGYVTAYSEWLPVPPPQLDVNIAMTQLAQPEVIKARAFEAGASTDAGVELTFSKYMKPEMLNAENIFVKGVKEDVETLIENLSFTYPGQEVAIEGSEQYYTQRVFAATDQLNQYDEVYVIVNSAVESYAGIQMATTYQQKIDIEKQLTSLSADSIINVSFGENTKLLIAGLPTEAAAGRKVRITSAAVQVVTLNEAQESVEVTLDADGQAEVTVNGALFGTTALKMEVVDEKITAQTMVNVVEAALLEPVKAPVASRISGTAVYRGQTVTLSCESEGATIYYTTDGTCPCESATRKVYQNAIAINEPMTLKVMAVGYNGTESDICEYNYLIRQSSLSISLMEGWNWTSHDLATPMEKSELESIASQILTQTESTSIDAEMAMKLKADGPQVKQLSGDQYNPTSRSITLNEGWNWLGYPIDQMLTVDDALARLNAEEGDFITNLTGGFAEYADGKWTGLLQTMSPGQGYLYKSASGKSFIYNTTPTSNARAYGHRPAPLSPWSVNAHQYPDMMCITAELFRAEEKQDDDLYHVGAFINDECRGIGQFANGILYISVYGNEGDGAIVFKAIDKETDEEKVLLLENDITFQADVAGSVKAALPLYIDIISSIKSVEADTDNSRYYNLQGQRIDQPKRKGLYIKGAKKILVR